MVPFYIEVEERWYHFHTYVEENQKNFFHFSHSFLIETDTTSVLVVEHFSGATNLVPKYH